MTNAFIGHAEAPTAPELAAALGPAAALWDSLRTVLADELQLGEAEWNSYSKKAGWALRVKMGKRNIVYLAPATGSFAANLVLGDRAIEAARNSRFPKSVVTMINMAKRYAEGTAIRIEVRNGKDIDLVKRLAAIKLAH
jgi:hypothetical protein